MTTAHKWINNSGTKELSNLFQALQGEKDLSSPRKLSAEAKRDSALVDKKSQDAHVDPLDAELTVFQSSTF